MSYTFTNKINMSIILIEIRGNLLLKYSLGIQNPNLWWTPTPHPPMEMDIIGL